ncbi:hypothetical protein CF326_g3085 [Tilletia indica]|uniref:CENP-V/GFA domain-containing protein n=1 Tax=Tilletia indica TaxID=43049 RepID=A0A177TMZ3_9BASI|nr:hypothetical protein CF326_g3085 [Tilletia indica]KAE8250847.1 hypothetical protein A4X13_0g4333 [Tilletia indica]
MTGPSTSVVIEEGTITPLTGSCFCKSLRYKLHPQRREDCTLTAYCHCSKCQILNGAPYVWTTHWVEGALTWIDGSSSSSSSSSPGISAVSTSDDTEPLLPNKPDLPKSLQTYNTMPGRKWKIRCRVCGTPMGSWSQAKLEWTIWPTSLDRPTTTVEKIADDGKKVTVTEVGSVKEITHWFRPTSHQFYGDWRAVDVQDDLPRFLGYPGKSEQVA